MRIRDLHASAVIRFVEVGPRRPCRRGWRTSRQRAIATEFGYISGKLTSRGGTSDSEADERTWKERERESERDDAARLARP